jgi:GNAT superfamily N-acetyltransferase
MAVHLYPVSPEHDYPRLAELINCVTDGSVSAALLHRLDAAGSAGRIRWQIVAVEDGRIVGYADTGRDPDMPSGHFWLTVAVDPERRGRGIGAMLLDDVQSFAWEQGATSLVFELASGDVDALRFVERHGFAPVEESDTGQTRLYALSLEGRGAIPAEQAELFSLIRRLSQELPDVASLSLLCEVLCLPACGEGNDDEPGPCLDMSASLWQRMLSLPRAG